MDQGNTNLHTNVPNDQSKYTLLEGDNTLITYTKMDYDIVKIKLQGINLEEIAKKGPYEMNQICYHQKNIGRTRIGGFGIKLDPTKDIKKYPWEIKK